MSVCKLKQLSNILGCSFSFLRYNVRAKYHNAKPFANYNNAIRSYSSSVNKLQDYPTQTIDINAITKGDEVLTKKLKVLILEVDVMRQEAMRVPNSLTDEKWSELLDLQSRNQRIKFLNYLWVNEKKKENRKLNKQKAQLDREAMYAKDKEEEDEHMKYGFGGSTIFIRIYNNTMDNFFNQRLVRAMMFGQDIVIDCSYDEYMNHIEASLCAKQLKILFAENRLRDDPYNIHFCNVNKKGNVFSKLHKSIPTMYDDAFPINITDKSYLELFKKERLVYLTPHCRNDLVEYSHDDIYIVGKLFIRDMLQYILPFISLILHQPFSHIF